MRRILFIFLWVPAVLAVEPMSSSVLNVPGLQQELASGRKLTVIDVRSPAAFSEDHIPGAINIPAPVCQYKSLPPIGNVVVYGDGLGGNEVEIAGAALGKKAGISVKVLDGGYAAWKSSAGLTTRGAGLKRESFNYITYAHLKAANTDGVVLFDLRKQSRSTAHTQTDLKGEFPRMKQAHSLQELSPAGSGSPPLVVLIDNGDGAAEEQARLLKAGGNRNYVILAGGELILSRKGQAGLQRKAPISTRVPKPSAGGAN